MLKTKRDNSIGCRVVGGAGIPNLTGEPIRNVSIISNFFLWMETEEDGARAKPANEKTVQANKNKIITHKSPAFFVKNAELKL